MADTYSLTESEGFGRNAPVIVHNYPPRPPWFGGAITKLVLVLSILANLYLVGLWQQYYPNVVNSEEFKSGSEYAKDKIAIIKVSGMILSETIGAPKRELLTAADDADVKAVVLEVETPGGSISGSDELYHAIVRFKEKTQKPVVVWMKGMATSGGYYISMPADKVFAERSCMTGSIGVIVSLINVEKLFDKLGVDSEVVKSGKMKDSGSMFRAMTEEERQDFQKMVATMFDQFIGVVLKHRSEKVGGEQKLRAVADGRIYLPKEAKDLGLIDEIGFQDDAIESAKSLAGLSGTEVRVITYARPFGLLSDLLGVRTQHEQASAALKLLDWHGPRLMLLPGPSLHVLSN